MKKGTIFAVCMAIFLMAWCVTPSVANETGGAPAGGPHRGAAADLMPEPEQPLVFAPPGAAPAPSAIYPGDYDIIFVDNWGDKFYLNKVHQNRAVRVYNGYWSSDWANGLIEPVSATFYGPNYCDSTASMSITAVFQGIKILSYTLSSSSSNNKYFSGTYTYIFMNNQHYKKFPYSTYIDIQKGALPTHAGACPKYHTP